MTERPRRERRTKEDSKDEGSENKTPTPSKTQGGTGEFFQKLVDAQGNQDEWKTKGGNFVWVVDEQDGFVYGEIKSQKGDVFEIVTNTGSIVNVKDGSFFPVNPPHVDGTEDMARLPHLNEAGVLQNLKYRYSKDNIYTYSGLFLVAINPYKPLPIYTQEFVQKHKGRNREDVPPHVFTIADHAYRGMVQNKSNQSMLVTGESGAGKTENTKKIIQYLTSVASSKGGGELEQRLLRTNPLLEAFGNARTIKNDNSSRFGKFIEINFNSSGYIIGTTIQNYLLETTRVLSQSQDERNYHIFYQILSDPQTKAKFKLTEVEDYEIVNKSGCTRISGVDDKKEFEFTLSSMAVIGMNEKEIEFILETIAGILHLGNIQFTKLKDGSQIEEKTALKNAAHFFHVKASSLEKSLIKPKYKVGTEMIETEQSPERAKFNKNSLLKSIYNRLFNWIVQRINESLSTKEVVKSWIGVLDIAGFEIFQLNSFEQLCINFTNEKLQQFFNHHMFVKEQEEYAREKIDWDFIDFGLDLQGTIDLIEKPLGIFSIMDDAVYAKTTDDSRLRETFVKNHGKKGVFKVDKFDKMIFNIVHYAGEVPYNIEGWLNKNVDPMNDDCAQTFFESTSKYVTYIFKDFGDTTKRKGGSSFATVSKEYKQQLGYLMDKLQSTEPHFIRCIIPNHIKKAGIIDSQLILHQLRCNGVLEGIRISRKGYPGRIIFKDFVNRYGLLCSETELRSVVSDKEKCNLIIKKAQLEVKKEFIVGTTKVFLKSGIEAKLEKLRDFYVDKIIITVQSCARGYLARQAYKKLIEQVNSVRLIQDNWRAYQKLKSWVWWDLFVAARPQVELWNQEQERLKQLKQIEELKAQIKSEIEAKKSIEGEKKTLGIEIQRILAEIDSKSQKLQDLLNDENTFRDKHRELEGTIEQYKREKQMALASKDKLLKSIRTKEDAIRQREKEVETLNQQIKDGGNSSTLLQNQIRDQTSQKLKLEAHQKRLNEELNDTKNKLTESSSKSSDLEREKNGVDDRIREVGYRIEVIDGEKNNLEKKRNETEKDLKEVEKKLKKAKADQSNFLQGNTQKDVQYQNLVAELQDLKRRLEETARQKKQLETLNTEFSTSLVDLDKKKSDVERDLRESKEEAENLKSLINKLNDDISKLEDTSKNETNELNELKSKMQKLQEAKSSLDKSKQDLEKSLADARFNLQDTKEKGQKEIDVLNKKTLDTERDLTEQINQITTAKNAAERKLREYEKQRKDLKKDFDKLQGEKDNLENLYKRLETSLNSEQGDLQEEKKKLTELELLRKDLNSKFLDTESKFKMDQETNQKLDQKRRELQNLTDSLKDKIELLEKERDELALEKQEVLKELNQLNLDMNEMTNQLNALTGKSDSQELEISTLKARLEDASALFNKLTSEGRNLDQKINEYNMSIESEVSEKNSLLKKLLKLEDEISKLKKRIDEEVEKCKKISQERNNIESELRDKRTLLDSETFNRQELEKKIKAFESKLQDLEKSKGETSESLTKLKNDEASLLSQVSSLSQEVDDLEHKTNDNDAAEKELKEKFSELDKKKNDLITQRQKLATENSRLKSEIDIQRELNGGNEKKAENTLDQLKHKMELNETEFEQKIKLLTNERDEAKKELKNLGKREVTGEGKVPKEVLSKITNDFQNEVERLRKEIEEERRNKSSQDNTRRTLETQLIEFKDQLEQEERLKKKTLLQKKNLQSEIDELKEIADEVEELNAELEKLKLDQETIQTELKNDIQRERSSRQAAEYNLIKYEREVQELKKAHEDAKMKDEDLIKKMKLDYEAQLEELDSSLGKEKKGKKSAKSTTIKSEREIRELERRLLATNREKQIIEEKESRFSKDVVKLRDDIQEDSKKFAQFEAQNKLVSREVDSLKQKIRDVEDEMEKVRNEALREHKNKGIKAKKSKKPVVSDSDEE